MTTKEAKIEARRMATAILNRVMETGIIFEEEISEIDQDKKIC